MDLRTADGVEGSESPEPLGSLSQATVWSYVSPGLSGKPGCFISLPGGTSPAFRGPPPSVRGFGLLSDPILFGSLPLPSFCDAEIPFQDFEVTACQGVMIPLNLGPPVSRSVSGGPRGKNPPLQPRLSHLYVAENPWSFPNLSWF